MALKFLIFQGDRASSGLISEFSPSKTVQGTVVERLQIGFAVLRFEIFMFGEQLPTSAASGGARNVRSSNWMDVQPYAEPMRRASQTDERVRPTGDFASISIV